MLNAKPILIVDDDSEILRVLEIFLKKLGCESDTSLTAESALVKARTNEYEAILLDIMLPDGDGVDVLKQIHKVSPEIPVIMITGVKDIQIATECMRSGAVDYITKPFDMEYLRTTVLSNICQF
jgi:DNA-binding NtrC family response regulator